MCVVVVLVVFIMHITPNKRVAVSGKECGKRDRGRTLLKPKSKDKEWEREGETTATAELVVRSC